MDMPRNKADLSVHVLNAISLNVGCDCFGKVGVELVTILLLQPFHVVRHIATIDVVLQ